MTQQINGTPELKYSEETFRDMYEALQSLWSALMFHHLAEDGKFGVIFAEKVEQALAKAEGK